MIIAAIYLGSDLGIIFKPDHNFSRIPVFEVGSLDSILACVETCWDSYFLGLFIIIRSKSEWCAAHLSMILL